MANPYYIPRENQALDLLNMGLKLYGLKQGADLEREKMALTEKELGMRGEQFNQDLILRSGDQALKQRQVGALEEGNVIHARTNQLNAMKLNPRERNWGLGDHVLMSNKFRQVGFEPEKITFLQELKKVAADDNVNRGAIAEQLAATWDQGAKQEFTTSLAENIDSILKKDPNADVTKQIEVLKAIEAIPADKVMQTFFPDIVQHDATEAAKTRTAKLPSFEEYLVASGKYSAEEISELLGKQKAERGQVVGPGATLVGQDGAPVYTNPNQTPGSDRPVSVAPGGTLVNPKTGRPIYTAPEKPEKPPTGTEIRVTADDVAKSESLIIGNSEKPEVQPHIDKVNQFSTKPYSWVWKAQDKTFLGVKYGEGGTATKISLPKIKGKQVTAKDVYDTAEQRGMTYEDVLRAIGALK